MQWKRDNKEKIPPKLHLVVSAISGSCTNVFGRARSQNCEAQIHYNCTRYKIDNGGQLHVVTLGV